ncbi:prenyltransferase/squalene oxidase repeat-containing protein [Planctomycetota bacterium]
MSKWYCRQNHVVLGPLSIDELRFLASRGKIGPLDELREVESTTWCQLHSVEGILTGIGDPSVAKEEENVDESSPRSTNADTAIANAGLEEEEFKRSTTPPPVPLRQEDNLRLFIASAAVIVFLLVLFFALLLHSTTGLIASNLKRPSRARGSNEMRNTEEAINSLRRENDRRSLSDDLKPTTDSRPTTPSDNNEQHSQDMRPDVLTLDEAIQPESQTALEGVFSVERLKKSIDSNPQFGEILAELPEMFEGRSREKRKQLVRSDGGTDESEAAVELGLNWLANHQSDDGSWSLGQFHMTGECAGQCRSGGIESKTAGTALALLPFLGAGYTPASKRYGDVVNAGIDWLVRDQLKNGSFRNCGGGSLYAHGQASMVLCEALALTSDESLFEPANLAIQYIINAQHKSGGWRYSPLSPGDTSVTGWQLLALRSSLAAGVGVPKNVFETTETFLDAVQVDKLGGKYAYMPNRAVTNAMTAEGLLCRQYTGWAKDKEGFEIGSNFILQRLPNSASPDMYYWYYATQVMHHIGGDKWKRWNTAIRETLIEMQEKDGHPAGSWTPNGGHSHAGGRIFMTSMAICTLEVYYRHAPLFETSE